MEPVVDKKVNLNLVGVNGNFFAIAATFRRQARREGWSSKEIDAVINEAKSGDYDHALATFINHCE